MNRAIHHWPMRMIVIVVAAATALLKWKNIPRMRKEIPFTDLFKNDINRKVKRPASAGLFCRKYCLKVADPSNFLLPHEKHYSS